MHILQWLIGLIVVGTSLWVLVDALNIGVKRGQMKGVASSGPVTWAVGCLLLWIIIFPWYLIVRNKYKRINDKPVDTNAATIFGFLLIAIVIGGLVWAAATGGKMSTQQLQQSVREGIAAKMAGNPAMQSMKVRSFKLVHTRGSLYEGTLTISDNGKVEKLMVDVDYDGKTCRWRVRPEVAPQ
ncbi:MAG: hypothetical protein P8Z49_01905 [Acidobacteriota bacterium]|jgi:hypothetical protein